MGFFHIHLPHINLGKAISSVEHEVGRLEHKIEHEVSSAARAVGKEASHLEHEVGHALGAVAKDVAHVGKEVEHALAAGVGFVGHEVGVGLRLAGHILQQIALTVGQTVLQLRPLRPAETQVASTVFGNTVPYDRVLISPLSGASSRPFTVPGTLVMTATAAAGMIIPGIGAVLLAAELLEGRISVP